MPISQKGKGNRRTGRSRGTSGRPRSERWDRDPDILRRVELAGDLYHHPMSQALDAVNLSLQRQGKDPISYATLKLDRERARELLRERVGRGMEHHLDRLQEVLQDAWRSLRRTPDGPARAPLYAVAIRCIEDMARLDGSWEAARQPVLMDAPSAEEFGPSPQELLERGEISQEAYHGFLLVLHRNSGGIGSTPAQALPEASGDVLEAQAVEVRGGSRPGSVRASTRRAESQPPLLPRMGDEVDGVVDWTPESDG